MSGTSRVAASNATSKGLVLDAIRAHGPVSRAKLAERTGLTQATMSILVRQLLDEGLVIEAGKEASTGGRPTALVDLNPKSRFAVGIEIGLESITYVTVNLAGAIVARMRTARPTGEMDDAIVDDIAQELRSMFAGADVDHRNVVGIGIVAPGTVDLGQGAILSSSDGDADGAHDVHLRDRLHAALGLPVAVQNDAAAAALGDFWGGGVPDTGTHATIYMGGSIAAGILVDGGVFRGASSNPGKLGQVVLSRDSDGRAHTVESLAAPGAVVASALASPEDAERLGLSATATLDSFRGISTAAARGEEYASSLLQSSAEQLAEAALCLANLFDLDSIRLAGPAFAIAGPIYVRAIRSLIGREFSARGNHTIDIRLSGNVNDAAAVGAAALVLQSEFAPRRT